MKLQHYLIASEHNDYKPWIITPTALAIFCLVIWSLRLVVPTSFTMAAAGLDPFDLMNKINSQRSQRFIPTLSTNSKLISAASSKSQDMLARSYFSHVDPDGNYVWPKIVAAGFSPYQALGENLAMDFTDADNVVQAWMNSPTHRANVLNDKFEEQGLASIAGTYEPNHDTIMVVSLFGTILKTNPPRPSPSPTPTPSPTPSVKPPPVPTPSPTPVSSNELVISKDLKITSTSLSGKTMVEINAEISGNPTLVTAKLKTQSISLLAGQTAGVYSGSFTFDSNENLSNETLSIEARDKNGKKITSSFPVNIILNDTVTGNQIANIPVSNEAQIMRVLRIIFGVFATIYMGFLAIDAIIIHRAKIKREGIHPATHLLIFALFSTITFFTNWA